MTTLEDRLNKYIEVRGSDYLPADAQKVVIRARVEQIGANLDTIEKQTEKITGSLVRKIKAIGSERKDIHIQDCGVETSRYAQQRYDKNPDPKLKYQSSQILLITTADLSKVREIRRAITLSGAFLDTTTYGLLKKTRDEMHDRLLNMAYDNGEAEAKILATRAGAILGRAERIEVAYPFGLNAYGGSGGSSKNLSNEGAGDPEDINPLRLVQTLEVTLRFSISYAPYAPAGKSKAK